MVPKLLAAAFLVVVAGSPAWTSGPALQVRESTWEPGFEVYHFASVAEGTSFREVFLVHRLAPGFQAPLTGLDFRSNGKPIQVAWEAQGPLVQEDDRFSFVQEAFDTKQVLTAHYGGNEVMECAYGGGAGVSITPDEWRALGLAGEVRCLQTLQDQMGSD